MAISVVQKSRQLGILKAMGIKDKKARFIFQFHYLLPEFTAVEIIDGRINPNLKN